MRKMIGRDPGYGGAGYSLGKRYDGTYHILWTLCDFGNGSFSPEQGHFTPHFGTEYAAIEEFLHRRADQIAAGRLVITAPEYIEMIRSADSAQLAEEGANNDTSPIEA